MTEPKIYSTSEWGAKPPVAGGFARADAEGIVVHNMEYPNRAPQTGDEEQHAAFDVSRRCQKDHMDRGWRDTGQHFTISRGGVIMEGRHTSLAGAKDGKVIQASHAGTNHHNRRWFGIELEGDYRAAPSITAEQWAALVELCAWLSFWGDFDAHSIKGHKEVGDTDCPGKLMDLRGDELRAAVASRKDEIAGGDI